MRKTIWKGLVCVLVVVTFLMPLNAVPVEEKLSYKYNESRQITNDMLINPDEVVDQSQTETRYEGWGMSAGFDSDQWLAQSFKPGLEKYTKLEILLDKLGNPTGEVIVGIRSSLTGEDLTLSSVSAEDIPQSWEGTWIEFDFPDIDVTVNQTYYIVVRGKGNFEYPDVIDWVFCPGGNPYKRGMMHFSTNGGLSWIDNIEDRDFCFITYAEDNPPTTPTITGPTSGKVGEEYEYTFSTTDIDGDDIYYWIEWGDGNIEEWIGPYKSGEEVTVAHTWEEKGSYTIKAKAKDVHDAESDWGVLKVSMPKTYEKPLCALLEKIFEWIEQRFGRNAFLEIFNTL